MNLPNKITLTRIFMIPVFVVVFYLGDLWVYNYLIAAGIFLLAALTDALDGYIARSRNLVTNMGKFLDPIADKVLVATAFIVLLTRPVVFTAYSEIFLTLAGICVALILARELIVSGFRLVAVEKRAVIAADKLGKVKTVVQDLTVVILLICMPFLGNEEMIALSHTGITLLLLATILTVVSGINYIVKNRTVLKDEGEKQ